MSARNEQRDKGGPQVAVFDRGSKQMAFHMMDANERAITGERERLRVHDTDEQRASQARARGDRDRLDGREA